MPIIYWKPTKGLTEYRYRDSSENRSSPRESKLRDYFINGRYVKSNIIAKAIEDAYKDFTMQHKYPFTALHFTMDGTDLDVNVHPTKMELRFSNQQGVYNFIYNALKQTLSEPELIPRVELPEAKEVPVKAEKNCRAKTRTTNDASQRRKKNTGYRGRKKSGLFYEKNAGEGNSIPSASDESKTNSCAISRSRKREL